MDFGDFWADTRADPHRFFRSWLAQPNTHIVSSRVSTIRSVYPLWVVETAERFCANRNPETSDLAVWVKG